MSRKIFFIASLLFTFGLFASVASAASLDRNLVAGSYGSDVLLLQKCLNESPDTLVSTTGAGSMGGETNYFGNLTKQAVIKYQNKYAQQILIPVGLTNGNGFVGPSTRSHLNANCKVLLGTNTQTTQTSTPVQTQTLVDNGYPVITGISPTEGPGGTDITLTGKNFDLFNDISISFSSKDRLQKVRSNNSGTSISFKLDEDGTAAFMGEIDGLSQKLLDEMPGSTDCDKETVYRKDPDGSYAHNSSGNRIVESIKKVNCKTKKATQLGQDEINRVNKVIDRFPDVPIKIYVTNKVGRSNTVEFNLQMEKISKFPR